MIISKKNKSKGSLLFELLIVISIIAVIFAVASNSMFLNLRGNKMMGDRDTAVSLVSETLEAIRSVADEDWQNIYSLTKGTGHYYPSQSANKWILLSGDENININNVIYTRYLTINNVSRDNSGNIENTYISANDDPSTQKITINVSWSDGTPVSISSYLFRWKNKTCGQAGWVTSGSGNTVKTCTDTTYDIADSSIDTAGGVLKLK